MEAGRDVFGGKGEVMGNTDPRGEEKDRKSTRLNSSH